MQSPFRYFDSPPEVIRLVVMMYARYPLSLRRGEDLWRAMDHEGEVLESLVSKARDKAAALKFIKSLIKRHGRPKAIVTDGQWSYRAAQKALGAPGLQETGGCKNNGAETSRQRFRR